MSNRINKWISSVQEQSWFIKLRSKWDELDAQSRLYIQGVTAAISVLLVFWMTIGSWWKIRLIRKEIAQKEEIIGSLQAGSDELKSLRDRIPPGRSLEEDKSPWNSYFESIATGIGLEKASIEISNENPGQSKQFSRESTFEISLKKVNVKQLTRFSFQVENGRRPVKIKKMAIETQADMSGYLDVKLNVSAYSVKKPS